MTLRLQRKLESLYGLERRKNKLGLEGTERVLQALGRPQDRFRAVHVAGTNGKGSVCAMIERVLRAAGLRTGLFTSPHLVDFRERIRVNGSWADEERLDRRLEVIQSLAGADDRTFFEIATALGFDAFADAGVEWAVVEVGLGGRLDTTNVLAPAITVITRVALDHTEILGATLEAVAGEKAGIIKPGVPAVVGDQPAAALRVIEARALERGAEQIPARHRVRLARATVDADGARFSAETSTWGALPLRIALRGRHQLENAATAIATLERLAREIPSITPETLAAGLAQARWPGRLEPCPAEPRLWWDGAHNREGIARLARAWRRDLGFEPPSTIVFATSRDKDAPEMLAALRSLAPDSRLVVTRADNPRALEIDAARGAAIAAGWEATALPDVASALDLALDGDGRVLLAGSLFAVGEAMQVMGGAPGERL